MCRLGTVAKKCCLLSFALACAHACVRMLACVRAGVAPLSLLLGLSTTPPFISLVYLRRPGVADPDAHSLGRLALLAEGGALKHELVLLVGEARLEFRQHGLGRVESRLQPHVTLRAGGMWQVN